jgi:F420-dependent oxidoreductase-like protein
VKLGIHLWDYSAWGDPGRLGPTLAAAARAADDGGAAAVTLMDHWFQMEHAGGPREPMLDGYAALGFLAGQTRRVDLGLLVTGVTYRHPGLLAKTVATLDALSGGRAFLGIGAAWYEREHHALGVPFPPLAERFERLEEAILICRQMWGDDDGPFVGKHFQLAETICVPRPLRWPGPPILIGGSGERKTLRLVAQFGDACNLFAPDPETVARKLDILARHCDDAGRDPAEIEKTIILGDDPLLDPDAFLAAMERYAALGVNQAWVGPTVADPADWVARVCDRIVPPLANLGPGLVIRPPIARRMRRGLGIERSRRSLPSPRRSEGAARPGRRRRIGPTVQPTDSSAPMPSASAMADVRPFVDPPGVAWWMPDRLRWTRAEPTDSACDPLRLSAARQHEVAGLGRGQAAKRAANELLHRGPVRQPG